MLQAVAERNVRNFVDDTMQRKTQQRLPRLCFHIGKSHDLVRDTSEVFLYLDFVSDRQGKATRNEDWPDSPTVKRNEGIKETKIMFCEKCGSPIKDDEKFCGKCGNAVVTNTDGVSETDCSSKGTSGKMTIMLYCIGVVLFAFAAIDYAGMYFDYDLTGVSWSPYAIGVLGGVCISIAKKLNPPKTEDND